MIARAPLDLGGELSTAGEPYADSCEILEVELRVTRARLRAVRDDLGKPISARREWPSDLLALEALAAGRTRSTLIDLPLGHLRSRLRLTQTEERVLWVLIAHELCPGSRGLLRELNTEHTSDPTTGALRAAVYDQVGARAAWTELAEDGALRRLGLIERTDGAGAAPFHRQTWKVADRVLALVHGEVGLDPALARLARLPIRTPSVGSLEVVAHVRDRINAALVGDGIVIAHGTAASGRRSLLAALLADVNRGVLEIDCHSIAKDREAAAREIRALARECALLGLVPLLRNLEALTAGGEVFDRLDLVEADLSGLVVSTASRSLPRRWQRVVTQVELPRLTGEQRARCWAMALPNASPELSDDLATLYPLAPGLIDAAGRLACDSAGIEPPTSAQISAGLRSVLDDRLAGLAKRLVITQTWDDFVLPEDQLTSIIELMARIREGRTVYEQWGFADKVGKGLGVSALFSGPPGTGKTMAAGLIGQELGVEVYQVDVSKIVSKWIGETEKNLASLFDAAEASHAILLFDEADSLFGKRTDVKSSNDRYANQEVNFLLQRLEAFSGIVILTTNNETAIDEAFRRRLSLHVHFPMPEHEERERLWKALLPEKAPTHGQLGLEKLAREYVMSGGYIRNAVLRAAFLAVSERTSIGHEHLAKAAQLEYEAMGKIVARK